MLLPVGDDCDNAPQRVLLTQLTSYDTCAAGYFPN